MNKTNCKIIKFTFINIILINILFIIFIYIYNVNTIYAFAIFNIIILIINVKIIKQILEVIEKKNEYKKQVKYDYLTHALNRGTFIRQLSTEMERSFRYKLNMSILLLDLDCFSDINNNHGHPVGDRALVKTVEEIENIIRNIDSVARLGGDELAIILPETSIKNAKIMAERIRKSIEEIIINDNIKFTISIGITELYIGDTIDTIYERSDNALLSAKNTGKNKIVVE